MPLTTRFFWGDIDLKWFPEASLSHPRSKGFYTVQHFMAGIAMPGAAVLNIRDWRQRLTAGQPMKETTPPQIADALDGAAAGTLASLQALRAAAREDSELRKNVTDCEALAWLGRYHVNVTALTEKVAADVHIARDWKPGSLKDDGKRGGTERGFRK
jgi:hypothetical protein